MHFLQTFLISYTIELIQKTYIHQAGSSSIIWSERVMVNYILIMGVGDMKKKQFKVIFSLTAALVFFMNTGSTAFANPVSFAPFTDVRSLVLFSLLVIALAVGFLLIIDLFRKKRKK